LVRDARVGPADHVFEIGAGTGRLTRPLAERAGRVTAVELDPSLVEGLRRSFGGRSNVRVAQADVLRVPFPSRPWRAFGNIPFALTTPILRRLLDDPAAGPDRADLLVQYEAARKRAAMHPGTLVSLGWLPWWELTLVRRVPRHGFDPPPAVDAGLLVITRRTPALVPQADRGAYVAMLRRAFDHGSWPVRRSMSGLLSPPAWKRVARERGLSVNAPPADLDVWDWVAVFLGLSRPPGR
jgi:23S rRNA (adenine-N6)-dimethyltransferase